MFSRVEHVDLVEEADDPIDLLHKIGFEFLASEPLAQMGGGLRRCYADEDMVGLKSSGK